VSLGDPVESKPTDAVGELAWGVRVYMKPFMVWVWLGCLMMALGGFVTLVDKRYRLRRTAPAASPSAGAVRAPTGAAGA
jgi:cytochrome c-type biogenesis protein CcmF